MNSIKASLSALWRDGRTLKKRLLISFLANFTLAFTLIIFTPSEMILNNLGEFVFSFGTAFLILCTAAAVYIAVSVGITVLLKGKIFDAVICAVLSFTLCCYIQGNFMNGSLSIMNGEAVDWSLLTKPALIGLGVWAVLFAVPFVLRALFGRVWDKIVIFCAVFLITVQGAALVSGAASADLYESGVNMYLSAEGLTEVSDKNNVIVIIADYFDNDYVDILLEENPEFFDGFNGFTRYTNFTSTYKQTMPTIPYLLSDSDWRLQTTSLAFSSAAFDGHTFIDDVSSLSCKTDIYTASTYIGEKAMSHASNGVNYVPEVSLKGFLKSMAIYVAYRDLPLACKAPFWFYTADISANSVKESFDSFRESENSGMYTINDAAFYSRLKESGVTVADYGTDSNFKFIHMMGGHSPYVINENGEAVDNSTPVEQYKGFFKIVSEYLEALKRAGVYDDTTIIIMADHGIVYVQDYLTEAPMPILLVKPAGETYSDEPFKNSAAPVCQEDFHATVLKALGAPDSMCAEYGRTFWDVSEDEDRTRKFYFRVAYDGSAEEKILEYEITGDANDIANWHLTGNKWE